ncbi:MAG: NUDIX domain-containing protein [Gammaproteobacteria bacterium]|nr:NUDIX domain-containing protein [Gammaproteobacteria bacterium]
MTKGEIFNSKRVDILSRERLHEGFLGIDRFELQHSLYSGGTSNKLHRERVDAFEAASVLLYDPRLDSAVMIEQFRIGAIDFPGGAWILEVVGGIIDDGESPEGVARREAVEEAGCTVGRIEPICRFMVSPGFTTERIHLFCGEVDASAAGGIHGLETEGEDIRVEVLGADALIDELYGGRINCTSALVAVQWFAMNRDRLRQQWR